MNYISSNILKSISRIGLVALCFNLLSCDNGFEEMNINPNAFSEPVIENMFTTSIIRTAGTGTNDRNRVFIKHISGMVQYMASLQPFWYGEKYIYNDQGGDYFNEAYLSHLKQLEQILPALAEDPDMINQYSIARIWRVFVMHRITDLYGDVPYFQAAQGLLTESYKPAYDRQQDIYENMLSELESAVSNFDSSKGSFGGGDVLYSGSTISWKKFANSLMLRLSMRVTKVDPAMAETWSKKAIAGGVFESNSDMAILEHFDGHGNTWNWDAFEIRRESLPESLQGTAKVKMSQNFVSLLKSLNDPRLSFYSTTWEGNIRANQPDILPETTMPEIQKGLPNGYDDNTISQAIAGWNNNQLKDYSEPNTGTIVHIEAPTVFLSYGEVEFLLAEAALRGWTNDDAQSHFRKGIEASLDATSLYPGDIPVTDSDKAAYLADMRLQGSMDQQMEAIHTQFYIAQFMFFDFLEGWSNWRRTGYPKLTPVNYPGNDTNGEIPRRLRFPQSEIGLNSTNYNEAIANQGPDLLMTRIWWDKE